MPPRNLAARPPPGSAAPSTHTDLVAVGSRQVRAKHPTGVDENGLLPSTARAVVLRNGKQGAMGTGELMSLRKPIGREKLELLGEDLLARSTKNALAALFNIERLVSTADAEYSAHVDSIKWLKDPDLFHHEISKEVYLNVPLSSGNTTPQDPLNDWDNVINVLGTRVHNSYMVASAWKIVRGRLEVLQREGIVNSQIRSQLTKDPHLRKEYLAVCDVLGALIDALQARFSFLAATAEHFRMYFKKYEERDSENPEYMFDWNALREAYKSYVDSIVIELCLPNSQYPKYILARILEDATQEAPREKKRFPQALFDALGDLAVALQLQETLEAPLLGKGGEQWRKQPRTMPEDLSLWIEAQSLSEEASRELGKNLDIIFPLEKTKEAGVVDAMWTRINDTYKTVTTMDLDTLWHVEDEFQRVPQWSITAPPTKRNAKAAAALPEARRIEGGGTTLQITDANDSDPSSMPGLEYSSDNNSLWEHSEGEDEPSDFEGEESSEYDSEEEAELRDMLREAMDIASAHPEIFEEKKAFKERSNDNQFLKALGALRGRLFSSNPRLRTNRPGTTLDFPKVSIDGQGPDGAYQYSLKHPDESPHCNTGRTGRIVTIEEVEDEDAPHTAAKKKKKKKAKKKKKLASAIGEVDGPGTSSPLPSSPTVEPSSPVIPSAPPVVEVLPSPAPTPQAKKRKPEKRPPVMQPPSLGSSSTSTFASMSTASLEQTRAQSAHAYLHSENLTEQKVKVKTRAEPRDRPLVEEQDTKIGFFSRFSRKKEVSLLAPEEEMTEKRNLGSWFRNMNRKSTGFLAQILGADKNAKKGGPPMKWDHFVKVMIDMGFEVDASTAGSSVRFQPPDPALRSISFHRPHPESSIDPITLQKWRKKLKSYYGWSEDVLLEHADLKC
ncbi:hypothetical protein F5148DRAFT_987108 [Russula earlei]|uniref:Uncharacterized protein n=1 Tax=Russula earlei TaxID=71964 RepID=A0ACC0TW44_9AGAM|nr:hypothetical protein F5148DRAFT_987108 [Russula earlei]